MKAGHASLTSSCCQPGSAAKVDGVSKGVATGTGSGVGITGGGMMTGGRTGDGTGGGGTGVVHAARASATIPVETGKLRRVKDIRITMWILMVEAGVALFLLVFIVWWTMYSGAKPTDHAALPPPEKKEPPERLDN
jgi:hypothetical protein